MGWKSRCAARIGYLVIFFAGGLARGDNESGFTGGDSATNQSAATVPVVTHKKHKKKHASVTPTTPAATAGTDAAPSAVGVTNEVGSPVLPPVTNAPPMTNAVPAESSEVAVEKASSNNGRVATLTTSDLREFARDSSAVQRLLAQSLALTTQNLSYKYGSSDPQNGGMDCSGTVYYLLMQAGVKDVPRDASEMYRWVWTSGRFQSVVSSSPDTFELARLKPGDLLFWSGTYRVDRDPPITHVMIYLGVNRATGRRVMVGASEGRRFNDTSRYGVSVFDFTMPRENAASEAPLGSASDLQARFVGYGPVPGLEKAQNDASAGSNPSSAN